MRFLRVFDSLKIVRAIFVALFAIFAFAPAHADIPAGYTQITSTNTTKYPSVLTGYTKYTITGSGTWNSVAASGNGERYFRYRIADTNIVGTGAQISNMFNSVGISASNTYVGFSFYYSSTYKNTNIGVRDRTKFTSDSELKSYLTENPLIVLVKTTTNTDNVYRLVKRDSDGVIGYYCTTGTNAGDFVPAFGAMEYIPIKIATTKYSEAKFAPVENDLNAARTVINDLITQMQTNAVNVSKLAVEKQTRPNADCPAGKNCLLVIDPTGAENWYVIAGAGDVETAPTTPDYFSFTVDVTDYVTNGQRFEFGFSPAGNFTIDWGDGTPPENLQTPTIMQPLMHEYATAGEYTIRITGRATEYNADFPVISFTEYGNGDTSIIKAIDGSLGTIFPTLGNGTGQQPNFASLFYGTSITSIPPHLFDGVTGAAQQMFDGTFVGTQITSIPAGLFSGITGAAPSMFSGTFMDTPITSIPENLFRGVTGAAPYMFADTFNYTQITSIPAGLFSGITGAADYMFYYTFYNCPNLSGYIPESTFTGLIANNSPDASDFMSNIFNRSTGLATTCPQNTTEVSTPYKSKYWSIGNGNAVMCRPNN